MRIFGVPLYRGIFWFRRSFFHFYLPTKQHVLYLFSNRFAVHISIIVVVFSSLLFHFFQGTHVRAETFGEKSLLYQLVADTTLNPIDEIVAKDRVVVFPTRYLDTYVIVANDHIDTHSTEDSYVTTTTGSSVVVSEETSTHKAARKEVATYVVVGGDTLIGIAYDYGLSLSTVLWANNLSATSTIQPGQELSIPPVDGVLYKVKSGDTISQIAKIYGAEAQEIVSFNTLASANALKIGQNLMIPGGEAPAPAAKQRSGSSLAQIFTPPSTISDATTIVSPSGKWIWPTDWRVITQYYGWRHTGVDIDGNNNTDNYAATDGVVTFTGWKGGYGLTVEIDHGNGIKTRYGHFSRIDVAAGQAVGAGISLGKTGTTGRSTGTHLHFEVIVNGSFRNPLDYVR